MQISAEEQGIVTAVDAKASLARAVADPAADHPPVQHQQRIWAPYQQMQQQQQTGVRLQQQMPRHNEGELARQQMMQQLQL